MNLRILLPFGVFAEKADVLRVVAETTDGSCGLLPNRLDCVAALVPGILTYEVKDSGTVYVGIDQGVLVKAGAQVTVSVRRAIGGSDLGKKKRRCRARLPETGRTGAQCPHCGCEDGKQLDGTSGGV